MRTDGVDRSIAISAMRESSLRHHGVCIFTGPAIRLLQLGITPALGANLVEPADM
jgi:hypothetical protein